MDFDLRLKALNRLAASTTNAAETAMRSEIEKVSTALDADTQYDRLAQHLDVLEAIGHRFSNATVKTLLGFIHAMESRQITYSLQEQVPDAEIAKYFNSSTLLVRTIEVLTGLRYWETKSVLHALLELSLHKFDNVRAAAIEALASLGHYDSKIFYGDDKHPGVGPTPQRLIIEDLEILVDDDLQKYSSAILELIDGLLSPTTHGTSWSYKSMTLSQGPTPALPMIGDIRHRSIQLLKRMYGKAATTALKLEILRALNGATRRHGFGRIDEPTANMFARNSVDVLTFFAAHIPVEELQIIQKIEDLSYWIFYHAITQDVEAAALSIEKAILQHSEYQTYKTLIGFEGKFHNWVDLKSSDDTEQDTDTLRKERALAYASSITPDNYEEWRERIIKYAKTESDDLATFPIFYYFLEIFANTNPALALHLLSTDSEQITGFLIPLLRGLWAGPQGSATRSLVTSWVQQGRHLQTCTRQFLANPNVDKAMLVLILDKARQLEDFDAVASVLSVAASNYNIDKSWLIDDLFVPALEVLTQHSKTSWIFDFWFRRESRMVVRELPDQKIDLVLRNLLALKTIEHQAEEVLYLIAQRTPTKVLSFLCQRLVAQSQDGEHLLSTYDAVPSRLHKLDKALSKIPGEAVRVVREHYDGNYSEFIFRGARLLKSIFPEFPQAFEAELLKIVETGGNTNCEFVLAILRNYEGQRFIHNVCKEIVKRLSSDNPFRTEVAIAMESTGVVTGEFGFAEAYEKKRLEVEDWKTDPDTKVQEFAKWYLEGLEAMSTAARKRAEEEIALRKHRYGEE